MAQAFIDRRLCALGTEGAVRSAGMVCPGAPAPAEVVAAMRSYGLDVASHRSRVVSTADLHEADLVLGMAREHVRHAVVLAPGVWPCAFSLKELIRRGERTGPRVYGESLADWLARVHEGRQTAALVGSSSADDIADPMGGPQRAYGATTAIIDQAVNRLIDLCWLSADHVLG
jgi:protein-tyrosine phosphatase